METLLKKLLSGDDIEFEGAQAIIDWIMSDQSTAVKAGALLVLLQAKGATTEEIAGAATAMRAKSIRIRAPEGVVDTASTGGNGISTFNISTCAAIIAAAAGAVVAKHGNRSNTRKSGSAEALQALGVDIGLEIEQVEACLQEIGICFCFAVNHHPAMKFAISRSYGIGHPYHFQHTRSPHQPCRFQQSSGRSSSLGIDRATGPGFQETWQRSHYGCHRSRWPL